MPIWTLLHGEGKLISLVSKKDVNGMYKTLTFIQCVW